MEQKHKATTGQFLPGLQVLSDRGSTLEPLKLGERVRQIRRSHSWTLEEASRKTGLAASTLSKIENEQMSPTFEAVQKLAAGLGIDIPQLFTPLAEGRSGGRRSVTRNGAGRRQPTVTYEHELLCAELTNKRMIPFKTRVRARSFSDFAGWVRHEGEEFLMVLEGAIIFYSEFYEALTLEQGDSVYYDSGMGHGCVSVSEEDALILWISVS
jgi:transcriptional regulator with XRE-family HTH domain